MITSITSCEKTTICVASNYIKICNTIDSVIHYYGSFAPIIYGDCRSIVLSPNNSNTEKTLQHLRDAQIPINRLCRDKYMKPIIMGGNRIDWSL
jgi:TBCC domain-containing protein 1